MTLLSKQKYNINLSSEEYINNGFSGLSRQYFYKKVLDDYNIDLTNEDESISYDNMLCRQGFNSNDLVEGIKDLLENLDIDICIASATSKDDIKMIIENTGLSDFFNDKNIFSAFDCERSKPFPDVYIKAREDMGYSTQECIAIDDSIAGVQSASSSGIDVIGFSLHKDNLLNTDNLLKSHAKAVIYNIEDIKRFIK